MLFVGFYCEFQALGSDKSFKTSPRGGSCGLNWAGSCGLNWARADGGEETGIGRKIGEGRRKWGSWGMLTALLGISVALCKDFALIKIKFGVSGGREAQPCGWG